MDDATLQPDPAIHGDGHGKPLNELGWVGIDPDAPDQNELRSFLAANNGMRGLEVLAPTDVEEAVRLFYRDGFVVVANALDDEQLDFLRGGCDRVIRDILALDKHRVGNRGSHRYSFGGASRTGHQMHHPEWSMLIDLPSVSPIITAIFGSPNYISRGGGGDFCLPGAVSYQPLHSDMSDRKTYADSTFGSFHDPRGQLTYRDLPCPYVCCNYLMVDFTAINGPIRQIPGTQHSRAPIPSLAAEPQWMKISTVNPAPAGSVLIRDVRAWHGGTPNLSNEVRAIPNAEFYAPWFREPIRPSMPRDLYEGLSDHGKRVCRYIVADADRELVTGYRADLGGTPTNKIKAYAARD
jgi:ectoine hydroxylase-related dioxygenase (phytanoyl-CoA dioxygenase family)